MPDIMPTGLRASLEGLTAGPAGPHLIWDEWLGSHDMVLWPTSRSTPRWKSLSLISRLRPPGSARAFWNGTVPAAMHLHLQIFHGHVFIYMMAIPAQFKAPTFITSSALFRLGMAAHVLLVYSRASGEIPPYPEEKVSLGLLFRGMMKEIIDSSFATVSGRCLNAHFSRACLT